MTKAKKESHCCPGCGRDTTAAFCPACSGGDVGSRRDRDGERGRRRGRVRWPDEVFDADRYDEESGPDDVFDDGNLTEVVQP